MKQVNLRLDEDEHLKLKVLAAIKDVGLNDMMQAILREYADKNCPALDKAQVND
jgi:predicted HicB family RNase H-like nuclease